MAGPAAADSAGDEYMTMDADQWLEHDDTYENGDTLGVDSRGKDGGTNSGEQKTEELQKQKVSTGRTLPNTLNPNTARRHIQALPDRYVTLRRPPMNANRGQGVNQPPQLAFFRYTTVFLMLQSILLLGVLLGLSIYYNRLSMMYMGVTEEAMELQKMKAALETELNTLKYLSRPVYQVSWYSNDTCLNGQDLFILNHEAFEEYMNSDVSSDFFLSRKDEEGCRILHSCYCNVTG